MVKYILVLCVLILSLATVSVSGADSLGESARFSLGGLANTVSQKLNQAESKVDSAIDTANRKTGGVFNGVAQDLKQGVQAVKNDLLGRTQPNEWTNNNNRPHRHHHSNPLQPEIDCPWKHNKARGFKGNKFHTPSARQLLPHLVRDYHPNPYLERTTVTGHEADVTARQIIREQAAWEATQPKQMKEYNIDELKDLARDISTETLAIKKAGKKFAKLARIVDQDDLAYKKAAADAAAATKKAAEDKARDLKAKADTKKLLADVAAKRKAVLEEKQKNQALKKMKKEQKKKLVEARTGATKKIDSLKKNVSKKKVNTPTSSTK